MAKQLLPQIRQQFSDANGVPLAGGKIFSYQAGTATPLATYIDATGLTANTNPIILDSGGCGVIFVGPDAYKFVVKDSLNNVIQTIDAVSYISPGSIIESMLADGAVTEAKIATGAVTTTKIGALAVTQAKLAAKTIVTQALTGLPSSATTATALTGTCTVTATGRPISIGLIGKLNSVPGLLKVTAPNSIDAQATIEIFRDSTRISSQTFGIKKKVSSQVFTSGGTYVVPTGITELFVREACGGGGGGGSSGTSANAAGGGGGSAVRSQRIAVTAGETLTIAIGAGGAAGNINGGAGSTGGSTTITNGSGTIIFTANGGSGGSQSSGTGTGWDRGGDGRGGGAGGGANLGTAGDTLKDNAATYAGGAAGGQSGGTNGGGGGGGGAGLRGSGGAGGLGRHTAPGTAGIAATGYGAGGGGSGGSGDGNRSDAGGAGSGGYLDLCDSPELSGGTQELTIPASAFSIVDSGASSGSRAYTVKVYVNNASTILSSTGDVLLQGFEL